MISALLDYAVRGINSDLKRMGLEMMMLEAEYGPHSRMIQQSSDRALVGAYVMACSGVYNTTDRDNLAYCGPLDRIVSLRQFAAKRHISLRFVESRPDDISATVRINRDGCSSAEPFDPNLGLYRMMLLDLNARGRQAHIRKL
jgi:hypothetical protein